MPVPDPGKKVLPVYVTGSGFKTLQIGISHRWHYFRVTSENNRKFINASLTVIFSVFRVHRYSLNPDPAKNLNTAWCLEFGNFFYMLNRQKM